ncbi:MAG: NAD-binding protein [Defluviicoccus sp.]|nr:NAD-binding protein [Defluviicoccus sp.]MDG4609817.1 NAD-binding protein [Defluviicoccus sp.]
MGSGGQRVTFIVLRFMRGPLLVLTAVYAVSMLGWAMIPGAVTDDGTEPPLSLFHAFYFLAYTATTTGFGELPHPFTEAQRMWATASLYAGVIAWLYAIGAIVRLVQNPHFQNVLAERRFTGAVLRLPGSFVIVCGFGNTGSLLTRGLSDAGIDTVILDRDPDRIAAVMLRDYRVATPALCADARIPDHLIGAGLMRPNCRAIVALTSEEEVNVKVAIAARLLNPAVQVITQATRPEFVEILTTFGPDVRVIDPFQTFARYLGTAVHGPVIHMLNEWLVGAPQANLAMYPEVPQGRWIICGFGRMGRCLRDAFAALGIRTVVIDPTISEIEAKAPDMVRGRANQTTLQQAGIEHAAGIVAGTNSDPENLGIVLNARAVNPDIFLVVRQNRYRNQVLFNAAAADLIMQPNLVSARRIHLLLIAPQLRTFFRHVRGYQLRGEREALDAIVTLLHDRVGTAVPRLWTVVLDAGRARSAVELLHRGLPVTLGDILRDPSDRSGTLACAALVLRSGAEVVAVPPEQRRLAEGDEILFCGSVSAHRLLDATLNNPYTLRFLVTGADRPRGTVMRWVMARSRRHTRRSSAACQ